MLILRFLHLNNSTGYIHKGQQWYNAIYNIKPFLTTLLDHFLVNYMHGKELLVEEFMVGYKKRLCSGA